MKKIVNFDEYIEDFVWDKQLHFPVPTVNYIRRRTGGDLLLDFDTVDEAEGKIIQVVRSAKNYLFVDRMDLLEWEWELAHDVDLIYEVLEYIMEFIGFAFTTGDYSELFSIGSKKVMIPAIERAKNNLVGARKTIPFPVEFRKGY